ARCIPAVAMWSVYDRGAPRARRRARAVYKEGIKISWGPRRDRHRVRGRLIMLVQPDLMMTSVISPLPLPAASPAAGEGGERRQPGEGCRLPLLSNFPLPRASRGTLSRKRERGRESAKAKKDSTHD